MLPDVPVKVIVGVADTTLSAAASVMVCGVLGTRLSAAGVAVTPPGSPDTETATVLLKEFREFASTEVGTPDAPLVMVADGGVTPSEKSGARTVPWTVNATVAECVVLPDVPVKVMVAAVEATFDAAASVMVC
jgi:hypothetical protein